MGVKLDGIDPQKEWGLIFLRDHYHPATPEMRNKTMTIPGMPGEWDFGSEWGSRPFSLPFGLIDYDRYELQRKLRAFVAFLMDAYGKPREIRLTFDYEPDKYYSVKVNGRVDVERALHTGRFNLPLIAHDPFAYAELSYKRDGVTTGITYDSGYQYAYDPAEIYMDSLYTLDQDISMTEAYSPGYYYENPSTFQWTYAKQYSGLHNHSHLNSNLIVEVEGSVINPRITNQETGATLYLPTISGQKIMVNTGKYSVNVDGNSRFTNGIENFFLHSGDNSLLFEGGEPNATVTFKWKHKFI